MRLFNGDCLSVMQSKEFQSLVNGKMAVIVTDPPFNINYHYKNYKDKMKEADYYSFLKKVLIYPSAIVHYPEAICRLSIELGYAPTRVVSWVYNSNTARQHRDIAFFGVNPDFRKVKQPYKNPKDKRIAERIAQGKGARLYDWWEINQVKNVSKSRGGVFTPLYYAVGSLETRDRHTSRRLRHHRPVYGQWHNRCRVQGIGKRLHRDRIRRDLF